MADKDPVLEELNRKFKQNVFPPDWINPKPKEQYDLLVIGGGPGGMTAATFARSLGFSVALVEKEHLGGECLSYGCIPSKALLRSSRLAGEIRKSADFGLETPKEWKVDFKSVIHRVHRLQTEISPHDAAEHFKKIGIDVFLGAGHFTDHSQFEVGNQKIHFKKALIITGTEPVPLEISGLSPSDYLTNQTVFNQTELPKRLAVIGGGPISCELSQAFLQFGSQVTLLTTATQLLPKDDPIASERIKKVFEEEGMKVFTQAHVHKVEKRGKEKLLYIEADKSKTPIVVDEILVAIGRKPAVDGWGLEKAGVDFDQHKGILTDEYLQTSNPSIYASGDITSEYKFTHISVELAKLAVNNALNGHHEKKSSLIIPWCTFTHPEIAHIGLNEQEAKNRNVQFETVMVELKDNDRAFVDGETTGFVKLLVEENNDHILGATIMAAHAGDMISELSVAMNGDKSLTALSRAIHPFPTQASILRTAAEAVLQGRLHTTAAH